MRAQFCLSGEQCVDGFLADASQLQERGRLGNKTADSESDAGHPPNGRRWRRRRQARGGHAAVRLEHQQHEDAAATSAAEAQVPTQPAEGRGRTLLQGLLPQ